MTFHQKQRVITPFGHGEVVYQRLASPDYSQAVSVSVKLDSRSENPLYNGTIIPADQVIPIN